MRSDLSGKDQIEIGRCKVNRSAIGARVLVRYGGKTQAQAVLSQSAFSYNDPLHFGLNFTSADIDLLTECTVQAAPQPARHNKGGSGASREEPRMVQSVSRGSQTSSGACSEWGLPDARISRNSFPKQSQNTRSREDAQRRNSSPASRLPDSIRLAALVE